MPLVLTYLLPFFLNFKVTCKYAEFESRIATKDHPIYCLIVNIPCNYLWSWIARAIASESATGNLYQFWIEENIDPSSAYKMGNFLYHWMQENPGVVDEKKAMEIYRMAMTYEYEGFNFFKN